MKAGTKLIDRWFPVAAVDWACGKPEGSGRNEKAIFTWFASRPIAQARAAVICSLLGDSGQDPDEQTIEVIERAVRTGDLGALEEIAGRIGDVEGKRPVVLDCFSGRGIIPLEAARLGVRSVGTDLSPVAVLASRILADWAIEDWSKEPDLFFAPAGTGDGDGEDDGDEAPPRLPNAGDGDPKLIADLRQFFAAVDRTVQLATRELYPRNADGSQAWGYLWAVTIPCDHCKRRFPLLASLVLRHPYAAAGDVGQAMCLVADDELGVWAVSVSDGVPVGRPTMAAAPGTKGKSARCPFSGCDHVHPLETVKAKGFAGQYEDAPLLAAELSSVRITDTRGRKRTVHPKVFRGLRDDEVQAALKIDQAGVAPIGDLSAIPTEPIAPGNASTIDATGYGYRTMAGLMNDRQAVLFAETARAIRVVQQDAVRDGVSDGYAAALAGYASSNLVRRLRYSTRGARLRSHGNGGGTKQNRCQVGDVFANESGISFGFDWIETGPGSGPGTWASLTKTTLTPLKTHIVGLSDLARPGMFRRASATALPYRDGTVDVIVTDPPYYEIFNYADVSDLAYVWLRRALADAVPDLFGEPGDALGLQDKSQEIVVKQGKAPEDHRTTDWYREQMSAAFSEMRRVLRPDGTLTVVYGHSDLKAWRRLLGALREAGFVVTSAWPSRSEDGDTAVASLKVTVTIGCRLPSPNRTTATAAQVEREVSELVRTQVPKWEAWNLALADQRMAAYGPAMEVVGRYRQILRPDGTEPELDHFLRVGRRAVAEAHAFHIDELPLDTFDAKTRFALFWLRAYGRGYVDKGEARFEAQSSELRIDDLRGSILAESSAGFALTFEAVAVITERSSVIHVVRSLAAAWTAGGTDGAGTVIAESGRDPDDAHVWGTAGELVRQLAASDAISMALTACQRNRSAITSTARHLGNRGRAQQLTINTAGEAL
jgi:putative DNA methylase